jgi:hypothetical protein
MQSSIKRHYIFIGRYTKAILLTPIREWYTNGLVRLVNDGTPLTVDKSKGFPLRAKGSKFRFA